MIESFRRPSTKRKGCIDTDKMAALDAWRRVDCRTRQALRRNFLSDLVEGYEVHILLLHKCDVQYFLRVISCINILLGSMLCHDFCLFVLDVLQTKIS